MKSGALVFLVAFVALAASWGGFVLAPQVQLGRVAQTNVIASSDLYPQARPGLAKQGAEVYRANGCMYCHSQQVGQDGVRVEVVLMEAGTNVTATLATLAKLNPDLAGLNAAALPASLPKAVATIPGTDGAAAIMRDFGKSGAKVEVRVIPFGADIARGWGSRRTVAQDYLFDDPVQPGTRRIGPDLANVGMRLPDANWHLRHLYAPQSEVKGSTMPPYRFLFETRKLGRAASPDALRLPAEIAPPAGYEIVPTAEARVLAEYLVSLRANSPLFEAPVTVPGAAPAPAAATNTAAATAWTASELPGVPAATPSVK